MGKRGLAICLEGGAGQIGGLDPFCSGFPIETNSQFEQCPIREKINGYYPQNKCCCSFSFFIKFLFFFHHKDTGLNCIFSSNGKNEKKNKYEVKSSKQSGWFVFVKQNGITGTKRANKWQRFTMYTTWNRFWHLTLFSSFFFASFVAHLQFA